MAFMQASDAREELILIGFDELFSKPVLHEMVRTGFHPACACRAGARTTGKWRVYAMFFTLISDGRFRVTGKGMPITGRILEFYRDHMVRII